MSNHSTPSSRSSEKHERQMTSYAHHTDTGDYITFSEHSPVPDTSAKNGFGITSLVLGILAVLGFWFPLTNLGIPAIGLVFGFLAQKRTTPEGRPLPTGSARAGMVLNVIGLAISLLLWGYVLYTMMSTDLPY